MAKQLATALLLLAFILQTFSRVVIVLDFYANRDFIAKNLCENRNRPKMNCCGKCLLSKQLKQEDNKEKQQPGHKNESGSQVLSSRSFYTTVTADPAATSPQFNIPRNTGYPVDQPAQFFHPPSC